MSFGESVQLIGILCQPDSQVPDHPTVIFLNAGVLHRVGANRFYVRLARRMAGEGITTFRFDFSGIGDSESREGQESFVERGILDTGEAMDMLSRTMGTQCFVLAGLCSGADVAFWTAIRDERVVGLAQMDPFAYKTFLFHVLRIPSVFRRRVTKLLDLDQWRYSIKARLIRMDLSSSTEDASYEKPEYLRRPPPRKEIADGLAGLVARGVRLFNFFSGDDSNFFNYPGQYQDCFPEVDFGDCLHLEYEPRADHTVTNLDHQKALADSMVKWVGTVRGETFGGTLASDVFLESS